MAIQRAGRWVGLALTMLAVACSSSNGPSVSLTVRGAVAANGSADRVANVAKSGASVRASGNQSGPGILTGDPASLAVGMYALYISPNGDCSNPTLVQNYGSQPSVKDMVQTPILFTGSPAAGTYSCIGIQMSDVLNFAPTTTFGYCDSGTTYAASIYNTNNTTLGDTSTYFRDINLNPITPLGTSANPVAEPVVILFTRDTTAAIARGFNSGQTIYLGASLVVPGSTTFVWGGSGTVASDSSAQVCYINPGRPSFE